MLPIYPSNMPPSQRIKEAKEKDAIKISEDYHYLIGDDILLRDRLEYDPSRLFGGTDEEEDEEDEED